MFRLAHSFNLIIPGGFSVFAGVGERTREGNDLYREMIESGVIKLGDKQVYTSFSSFFNIYQMLNCFDHGNFLLTLWTTLAG